MPNGHYLANVQIREMITFKPFWHRSHLAPIGLLFCYNPRYLGLQQIRRWCPRVFLKPFGESSDVRSPLSLQASIQSLANKAGEGPSPRTPGSTSALLSTTWGTILVLEPGTDEQSSRYQDVYSLILEKQFWCDYIVLPRKRIFVKLTLPFFVNLLQFPIERGRDLCAHRACLGGDIGTRIGKPVAKF